MRTLDELKQIPVLRIERTAIDGGCGVILINGWQGTVIWSFGGGWEHVSVAPARLKIVPSWEDMCQLKDIFFRDDETVVQYHPAKENYVNMMPNCLHLWKPTKEELPIPPRIFV